MQDSLRYKGMREELIKKLRNSGIKDEKVLNAFNKVPRHFFLDTTFAEQAYSDMAFQIGAGQTISHPYTVAFQTELLQLERGDKVLEIGTGSGFQTSILAELGVKVFSIERHKELHLKAKNILHQIPLKIRTPKKKKKSKAKPLTRIIFLPQLLRNPNRILRLNTL